ncbi:TetR/AcrR family transcriptional regulator [Myxococcus sp. K15C18031901]|uniref:TetR/AcrR family transcriptional regulator n=1 Tax=Myxococcus dinghuensis TaxID=2906761 RepID=UPI0020A828DB|nr:TetR/AcrR family transcriptional regulator [Myxococcus dinghuensis]MCP3103367.1 TetR/AcrR family transcriptional regulator [Myxococcus dinghuensis]
MSPEQRIVIVSAATQHFALHGFSATSLEDVARRAGLPPECIHQHFESKAALFAVVVRQVSQQMHEEIEAAIARAASPEDKMLAFVETRQGQVERTLRELRVSTEALVDMLPLVDPLLVDVRAREVLLLEHILNEGNRRGVFAIHNPRGVALAMASALQNIERVLLQVQLGADFTDGPEDPLVSAPRPPRHRLH